MAYVQDFTWTSGITVGELVKHFGAIGYQSVELARAKETIVKMKRASSKIFLTFTSNMVTTGLRGFFAQLIKLGMADVIVTTAGAIEEDIMKAMGERFPIGTFSMDDVELHERGDNRVGNLIITNESYCRLEEQLLPMLNKVYAKQQRLTVSELLRELGLQLHDEKSILYQAAKNDVPIFCPGITDGALGFHLFMYQQKHDDFVIDVVKDFKRIVLVTSHDDIKGVIALGGGISKHHAILACLLNGGARYAVYMTTARSTSGSMSGATTNEAKSWGKVQDESDIATVIGDVAITFPIAMIAALEELKQEGLLNGKIPAA